MDRRNITGLWEGTYVYPSYEGPTTPFVANLVDRDGDFSGSTLEPNLNGILGESEELEATIVGRRQDRAIDFTKTYDGTVVGDSIDYVGQLSEDGTMISGVWSNAEMDGTFEMHRDARLEDLVTAEEEAELPQQPQPATVPDALN